MFSIIQKEITAFFSSSIAYVVITIFLLFNGLFLFVFKTNYNIFNAGFADLGNFFFLAPWFFLFLIPATTMRSFSEEYKTGTIEIILTKPISILQLVLGKFIGVYLLMIFALIPSVIYVITIYFLGNPIGNLDIGATVGSSIGMLFIVSAFISMGLFTSSLTNNQIVAFLSAVLCGFIFFYGFNLLSDFKLFKPFNIQKLGIYSHYSSISRGVLDTRDIVYFISLTFLFLGFTQIKIHNFLDKE